MKKFRTPPNSACQNYDWLPALGVNYRSFPHVLVPGTRWALLLQTDAQVHVNAVRYVRHSCLGHPAEPDTRHATRPQVRAWNAHCLAQQQIPTPAGAWTRRQDQLEAPNACRPVRTDPPALHHCASSLREDSAAHEREYTGLDVVTRKSLHEYVHVQYNDENPVPKICAGSQKTDHHNHPPQFPANPTACSGGQGQPCRH